jgi:ubiquinone/menaquinone biosynthesis C-methylase UbiE
LGLVPITHTLDASSSMIERLKKRISDKGLNVVTSQGFVECIPYEDKFDAILFMNGFFQVRSDYEAFIEINRSLKLGGRCYFVATSGNITDEVIMEYIKNQDENEDSGDFTIA